MPKYTPAIIADVRATADTMSIKAQAIKYGVSVGTIHRWRKLPPPHAKTPKVTIEQIAKMARDEHTTYGNIVAKYNF